MAQYSHSMRENYAGGVSAYYTAVASTYRNPSFGAVRIALSNVFSTLYEHEVLADGARARHKARCERRSAYLSSLGAPADALGEDLTVLDLACGAGEATAVLKEWEAVGRTLSPASVPARTATAARHRVVGSTKARHIGLAEDSPGVRILGADPYTEQAFRTAHPGTPFVPLGFDDCDALSLTSLLDIQGNGTTADEVTEDCFDLCIISFALHLIAQDQSALYRCLSALSRRARWLLVVSPHKLPLIKACGATYGWRQVDLAASTGSAAPGAGDDWRYVDEDPAKRGREGGGEAGELVMERVHVRLYRSQELPS